MLMNIIAFGYLLSAFVVMLHTIWCYDRIVEKRVQSLQSIWISREVAMRLVSTTQVFMILTPVLNTAIAVNILRVGYTRMGEFFTRKPKMAGV